MTKITETINQEVESIRKYLSKTDMEFFLKKALKNQKLNHANIDTVAKWDQQVEIYIEALK